MLILSKWYADSVTHGGDVFIGYRARLKLPLLAIPYVSTSLWPAGEAAQQRTLFRDTPEPVLHNGTFHWRCSRLALDGRWQPILAPYERILVASPEVSIIWRCEVPGAITHVRMNNQSIGEGMGYVDHVSLYLKGWRLPFDTLYWGRFLSRDNVITWIKWCGKSPQQWVYHNGVWRSDVVIGDQCVEPSNSQWALKIQKARVLHDHSLWSAVFSSLSGISHILPRSCFRAHETKWLSRGQFSTDNYSCSGWIIHELVRWL